MLTIPVNANRERCIMQPPNLSNVFEKSLCGPSNSLEIHLCKRFLATHGPKGKSDLPNELIEIFWSSPYRLRLQATSLKGRNEIAFSQENVSDFLIAPKPTKG